MENINITSFESLITPKSLKSLHKTTPSIQNLITVTRTEIKNIIDGKSNKKLLIVGPCSIHNVTQALEYAKKLKLIADKVNDTFLIVMRVYFEKPRTTIGWKGLINDPRLDNTCNVNEGLLLARKLLIDINDLGLPCGYEVLDTITPQYIADLISWGAVGARTTESQVHRQLVSGLTMPVGFNNGTNGDMVIARDAVLSASYPHCFMGITDKGEPAICKTSGNQSCHVILRGGKSGPNYHRQDVERMRDLLIEKNLYPSIMVDCSHGNSGKNYKNQASVFDKTIENMRHLGSIKGAMIESNINEGKQPLCDNLKYGVSITDSCISIEETDVIITRARDSLNHTNSI